MLLNSCQMVLQQVVRRVNIPNLLLTFLKELKIRFNLRFLRIRHLRLFISTGQAKILLKLIIFNLLITMRRLIPRKDFQPAQSCIKECIRSKWHNFSSNSKSISIINSSNNSNSSNNFFQSPNTTTIIKHLCFKTCSLPLTSKTIVTCLLLVHRALITSRLTCPHKRCLSK